MKLRKHIHIQQGFQSSVNIAYDLQSDEKLENFIPTNGVMDVLESLLLSTYEQKAVQVCIKDRIWVHHQPQLCI